MLTSLKLKNFRGFNNHEIIFGPLTVVVGQNNAGKSTIVEALRLISIIVNRYKYLEYHEAPAWLKIPEIWFGVTPSLRNLEINNESIFHRYQEPPAVIEAIFSNKNTVTIYLGEEYDIHAVLRNKSNDIIMSKSQAGKFDLPNISIMPQVAPVQRKEKVLDPKYVENAMSSSLAPLHFRNQLYFNQDLFRDFKEEVETTWPQIRIEELIDHVELPGRRLYLEVRDGDFVAELAIMGHGLQMWLQTMWFLTRSRNASTVILDEPDVYMHADLQRRLIRHICGKFPQIVITTHSVEIISEVIPEEIVVIDKRRERSSFASSLPAVQSLIESVGSVHNVHLAKLWHTRRFVMIEGKDIRILKQFQDTLFPNSAIPFDTIPHISIGGWGGWNYAVGSSMTLYNAFGESILPYCILDSDYHTDEDIAKRKNEAEKRGVNLHIWQRKEIENYLLVPEAILRLIDKKIAKRTTSPTLEEVTRKLKEIAAEMETVVFDGLSAEILAWDPSLGSGGANKAARDILKSGKAISNGLLNLVSGKVLISRLSKWSQDEFGISLSTVGIAREIRKDEISNEVKKVVTSIERAKLFI